ncbi:MAG: Bug family tripartite tricarboxylate transporter substrate binding protein [Polaromonas sp.]
MLRQPQARHVLKALAAVLLCAAASTTSVLAQGFPSKPIKITLGLPVGSGPDAITRVIGQRMATDLGQSVIVDNKPGASGTLAMGLGSRAPADGHELNLVDGGDVAINKYVFKKLPYDLSRDFEPVGLVFRAYFFLTVPANSPFKTVQELVAYAKAHPGELTYGSFGAAHTTRLSMERFMQAAGIQMLHIPFKDTGQLIAATASGEVSVIMNGAASVRSGVDSGKLRMLAVAADARQPTHPAVPTIAESGGPKFEPQVVWVGLMAPKGTPKDVISKLNASLQKALSDPSIKQRLDAFVMFPAPGTPQDFAAFIRAEDERYGKLVKALNIQLD